MSPIGENEFLFILQGLKWTVLLAIIGFVGGGVFGGGFDSEKLD